MSSFSSEPARTLRRKGVQLSLAAAVAAVLASQSALAGGVTLSRGTLVVNNSTASTSAGAGLLSERGGRGLGTVRL